MHLLGKTLIYTGLIILCAGLLFYIFSKIGSPLGQLPGDIRIEKTKFTIYAPLTTSLVISLLLTLIINLILWFLRKP